MKYNKIWRLKLFATPITEEKIMHSSWIQIVHLNFEFEFVLSKAGFWTSFSLSWS